MAAKTKNSLIKTSAKIWLRMFFASMMCFIVWFSFDALGISVFGDVTGYEIYEYDENGENPQLVVEHTYTQDEDTSKKVELKDNQTLIPIRKMTKGEERTVDTISSVFMLLIFALFPYNVLWNMGSHDENYVQLGRMEKDIAFGLKVGAVASVPSFLLYMLLVLGKFGVVPGVILKWHRLLNPPFIPYIDAVEMGANTATELSIGSLLAVGAILLFIPAVCWLAYYLGYRQISIRDKLVYKKPSKK